MYLSKQCRFLIVNLEKLSGSASDLYLFYRYSAKFWQNLYANTAEKCVISTHTGPICQFAAGMATPLALSKELVTAGFKKPLMGKVAISSFMGEWGYLLTTKKTTVSTHGI